jgi:DNA-binding XRE family transcriptional regulator
MARKQTRQETGGRGAETPSLPESPNPSSDESNLSTRKTRGKASLRHPETDAADDITFGGGRTSSSVSPSRRGVIYLDADTLRPIKPPVVIARKLERPDFSARWQIEFGQRLSAARTRLGLSQSDLARKSGVRQPHISKLEAGEMEPRLSTIFAIADTLGVVARSLFPAMSWQNDEKLTHL